MIFITFYILVTQPREPVQARADNLCTNYESLNIVTIQNLKNEKKSHEIYMLWTADDDIE